MPGLKRPRTHADTFADLQDRAPVDFDPEDERPVDSDDSAPEEDGLDGLSGREHYAPVGKSALRKPAQAVLGPQYAGSKIARNGILQEDSDHDPFANLDDDSDVSDDEEEEEEEEEDEASNSDWDEGAENLDNKIEDMRSDDEQDTDMTSISDDAEDDMPVSGTPQTDDRQELKRLVNDGRKSVAASIAAATKADIDKGRAVKLQRKTFDSLLNTRIRLQQGLIAVNSLPQPDSEPSPAAHDAVKAAEAAALNLWTTIDGLRDALADARTGSKRKRTPASTPNSSEQLWARMQDHEAQTQPHRRNILSKWSTKTQSATTRPSSSRLNQASGPSTIVHVLDEQLADPTRLIKRTQQPRSAAPLQAAQGVAESSDIFDDGDFYGLLLKELLEQRSSDAATAGGADAAAQQWEAARRVKTHKAVDVKASKGRKMRFTVHEKLQNFMAPEDRGTWGERQIGELFASLLGNKPAVEMARDVSDDDEEGEEAALRLFRS